MGWAYSEQGLTEKAILHIKLARERYLQLDYPVSLEYALASLMDEYLKLGRWQQIITLANIAGQSTAQESNVNSRLQTCDLPWHEASTSMFHCFSNNYLANTYLARAYYQLAQFSAAQQVMAFTKNHYSDRWTADNELKLTLYRRSQQNANVEKIILNDELSSHLTYCDSLWNTDNIDALPSLITDTQSSSFK